MGCGVHGNSLLSPQLLCKSKIILLKSLFKKIKPLSFFLWLFIDTFMPAEMCHNLAQFYLLLKLPASYSNLCIRIVCSFSFINVYWQHTMLQEIYVVLGLQRLIKYDSCPTRHSCPGNTDWHKIFFVFFFLRNIPWIHFAICIKNMKKIKLKFSSS